jgi:16S rRNA (cytidine1402-2'-O)-methyltransferase
MLYLVPTPVGNLKDITLRAIETLREVDCILCEDTRVSGKLLKHLEIDNKMSAFHAHNEHHAVDRWIEALKAGKKIAQISDAGTPGLSDPGFLLVRACYENDIPVTALPGATALIPALVMSGLPCDRFYFEGFLPQKKGRQTRLKFLATLPCTIVLYESPHRIVKCLDQVAEFLGEEKQVAVIRELSKLHEEVIKGTASEVSLILKERQSIKGEIVLIVSNS